MKLQIHTTNFSADQKLLSFVQKKMDKLESFYEHTIDGEVFLRLNNEGVNNKTVEVKLRVPGSQFFAKEQAPLFEEALDKATFAMKKQLQKFKEKTARKRN